jgi:putative MATE family efflux protein
MFAPMNKNQQITTREILTLAIPIYIGLLSNTLVGIVDTAFLGRTGIDEQSAAGYGSLFYLIFYLIGYGFVLGPQIIIARRVGESAFSSVGKIFTHSLWIMIIYSLILILFIHTGAQFLFYEILHSSSLALGTTSYLSIRSAGIIFTMLNLCFMAFFVGTGNSKAIGVSSIIAALVNVVLDYLLIFGYGNIEAMGLEGAAWASAISDFSGTLVYVIWVYINRSFKPFAIKLRFTLQKNITNELFQISIPLIFQNFLSITAWFIFFTFIEKTGKENFGISIIIRSIYSVFMISAISLGSASNSLVSNLIGQHRSDDVLQTLYKVSRIGIIAMIMLTIPLWVFPEYMFMLFTNDESIITQSLGSLRVIIFALYFFSVSNVFFQSVSGTGNTKISLWIEGGCIFLYLLYAYYFSIFNYQGLPVIWGAEVLYMSSFGTVAFIYMHTGKWKNKKI